MPYKRETINPISGQRLKEELKNNGYTHAAFGDLVNLDTKVIGFLCQGKRRITEKRAEEFSKILGVRPEYLLGLDDYRTRDREWLKTSTSAEAAKQAFFEYCLSFWKYEIAGSTPIYEEDDNGDQVVIGMNYRIKKPSGDMIETTDKILRQLENEILDFTLFKIQSLE
jgi:plasmid maintenance system antidote protein VapI